jgi:alkylated DNA nucleotide flippase Atl1
MAWQDFASLDVLDLCKKMQSTCENGLSCDEAKKRLSVHGLNSVSADRVGVWRIFWRQLSSPFIYLLLAATVLSFALKNWAEGAMVLSFIVVNAILGFFQEYRSERTARIVGGIAHTGPEELPWHRLVNAEGGLAIGYPGGQEVQRQLLAHDGVDCDDKYRVINFGDRRWRPQEYNPNLLSL